MLKNEYLTCTFHSRKMIIFSTQYNKMTRHISHFHLFI
uniref:Uncharacterized protein n=1 Tax=Anguilla anguilla TaxID=7936 RepID=A0A0E9UBZ8_ANGAN